MSAPDRVLHVAEGAGLRPVAVDLERAVCERALDEAGTTIPYWPLWRGPTVLKRRTITQSRLALLVVREREELVHRLRVGVRPAARRGRPVDAPGALVERQLLAVVAVDLGRRGDEHALAEAGAVVEHDLRPLEVRDERVDGLLDDQPHADRRRQVVDDVALVHELVDDRRLEHRVDDEVEVLAGHQVLDVPHRARREVVERVDLRAFAQKSLAEMGADEAGAARDESPLPHARQAYRSARARHRPVG